MKRSILQRYFILVLFALIPVCVVAALDHDSKHDSQAEPPNNIIERDLSSNGVAEVEASLPDSLSSAHTVSTDDPDGSTQCEGSDYNTHSGGAEKHFTCYPVIQNGQKSRVEFEVRVKCAADLWGYINVDISSRIIKMGCRENQLQQWRSR